MNDQSSKQLIEAIKRISRTLEKIEAQLRNYTQEQGGDEFLHMSKDFYLTKDKYLADGGLYLAVHDIDGDLTAVLTKCLDGMTLHEDEAYVDVNNCPWAKDFIEINKLGTPTGVSTGSGYCLYPLYKFDLEKVEEYCR